MQKIAMIASIMYSNSDGIFKKVMSQAKALSMHSEQCDLYCLGNCNVIKIVFIQGEFMSLAECNESELNEHENGILWYVAQTANLLRVVGRELNTHDIELVYIRHMIPSPRLIKLLFNIKKSKAKIIYEIPTYPYFYEQFRVSSSKLKAVLKIIFESIFWPFIYSQVDILSTVFCNTHTKKFTKMISMYNGIESLSTLEKVDGVSNLATSKFEIIGVGTVYPYHGFDRVLYSLAECKGYLMNGKKVIFNIVGESDEIEKLKQLAVKLSVSDNVVFHGKQFGPDLDSIFEQCLLGVGTLKLSIRNADIDTALKNIEYLGRNLPVLTSGRIFDINSDDNLYKVVKENEKIDFNEIYEFSKKFYSEGTFRIMYNYLGHFEWKNIMKNILKNVIEDKL